MLPLLFLLAFLPLSSFAQSETLAGPLYSDFRLTLDPGWRQEFLGPLFYSDQIDSQSQWSLTPLITHTVTTNVDWSETEFLYPVFTSRRFGSEYRTQLLQILSFSGGNNPDGPGVHLFTLFPLYFQARSTNASLDYTAVVPFYGHLRNRLLRDETTFIMFPVYSETRKKDVVADNYIYPVFGFRNGDQLHGWKVWPLIGNEKKGLTFTTNNLDEVQRIGGYDRWFAVWPFFLDEQSGLGTTNPAARFVVIPFYSRLRSPLRDESSYGWPFGYWRINDRDQKYREQDLIWPLFVYARGSKTETRIFPLYSRASSAGLESDFYLWPLYKYNMLKTDAIERQRTRIAFFLYSDLRETPADGTTPLHRVDFWPFFTWRRDFDKSERFQALAILEPFFPNNRSFEREYSQLWSLWRSEKNVKTGAASQSLLWNLYRRETAPKLKKISLLFGLFQYQSDAQGKSWRVCYIPIGKKKPRPTAPGT